MSTVFPCICFDGDADAAVELYARTFRDVVVLLRMAHQDDTVAPAGTTMLVDFEVAGQRIRALNAGPKLAVPGNISLYYYCRDQAEIDHVWETLLDGGEALACGWLRDKFGVLWQIVPQQIDELLSGDPARTQRVLIAVWGMVKLDLAAMLAAAKAPTDA